MTVEPGSVDRALEGLRALVRADGGDLALAAVDGDKVVLTLILEDAECAECVMPRSFLEQLALDRLRADVPGVGAVIITDPREG